MLKLKSAISKNSAKLIFKKPIFLNILWVKLLFLNLGIFFAFYRNDQIKSANSRLFREEDVHFLIHLFIGLPTYQ